MSRQTWLIGDTHFYHGRLTEYCGRPKNFTDEILGRWQEAVSQDDLIYHLGDVIFKHDGDLESVLEILPGIKVLIKGNHDKKPYQWYLERGFAAVCDYIVVDCRTRMRGTFMKYRKILLSHKPMNIPEGVDVNIHGHFHNSLLERWEKELVANLTENHYLFALENVGYRPILLSRAIEDNLVLKSIKNEGKKGSL